MKKLASIVMCFVLLNCMVSKGRLSDVLVLADVSRIVYSDGNNKAVLSVEEQEQIEQLLVILGNARRTPIKFIIRENMQLITSKETYELGMSGQSLNVKGITYQLKAKDYESLLAVLKAGKVTK